MINNIITLIGTIPGIIFCVILFILMIVLFVLGRLIGKLQAEKSLKVKIEDARKDALKRSRSVLGGQAAEQVAPFLPDFPCNVADVRFIGKPIDFIGFPGAAEGNEIQEILLIEVKSGNSVLSKREKEIKEAVQKGRVRYVEYRTEQV